MNYIRNAVYLLDNYVIARWLNKPSTASFWYLPEPPTIATKTDLLHYQSSSTAPRYLIDYRQKLQYSLENKAGIIVLPYQKPIGARVNPEAAFQYALGLHDHYCVSQNPVYLNQFWRYAEYFVSTQSAEGLWAYDFDWFGSTAPWYSALAQARGASVMLRAWMRNHDAIYLTAAKKALANFMRPIAEGGFLHSFTLKSCSYFEEYPKTPTGVINGFMASLLSIWEMKYWLCEAWLEDLWVMGIQSLETMLPYYSTGWWSLYDLDSQTPILNVNSPRYHLLEMNYLKVLSLLSGSILLENELKTRTRQYQHFLSRQRALGLKLMRKILYK